MNMLQYFAENADLSPLPQVDVSSNSPFNSALDVVFVILGGIALIVIIVAGIRLMLSRGDPQGVAKARDTIIYAAVGLAVAVSAYTILNFVVGRL